MNRSALRSFFLAIALLAGALVRVPFLSQPGMVDVGTWKIWSFAGATDLTGFYGVGGTPPERRLLKWRGMEGTTEYLPLSLYELGLAGRVYRWMDPLFADTPALNVVIKTPALLAEVIFVALMLTWGCRVLGRDAATFVAVAFWLNPTIVLAGSILGYIDALMAVPAILSAVAIAAGSPLLAGALAGAAVLTKAQAVFVLPALAIGAATIRPGLRARLLGRFVAGGLLATVLVVGPVVMRGAGPNMIQAMTRLFAHDMISGYALNLWWIATWVVRSLDSLDLGWWTAFSLEVRILRITDWLRTYPNPRPIGTTLIVLFWMLGVWRLARRRPDLGTVALVAAWCVYAYTMVGIQVHENHLYLAVPFLVVAAGLDSSLKWLCAAVSMMTALNMYLFYGLGEGFPPVIQRAWTGIDISVPMSVVNVAIFWWCTREMVRRTSGDVAAGRVTTGTAQRSGGDATPAASGA